MGATGVEQQLPVQPRGPFQDAGSIRAQDADQVSAGETFCPLQLPSTCANAIGLPLLTSVEDILNSASAGVAAAANAAPKISARILPS